MQTSAQEMFDAVTGEFPDQDIVIKAQAAVADYRPRHVGDEKMKKRVTVFSLRWNGRKTF